MLSQKAGKTKLLKVNNLLRLKWNISFFINQKDTKKPVRGKLFAIFSHVPFSYKCISN